MTESSWHSKLTITTIHTPDQQGSQDWNLGKEAWWLLPITPPAVEAGPFLSGNCGGKGGTAWLYPSLLCHVPVVWSSSLALSLSEHLFPCNMGPPPAAMSGELRASCSLRRMPAPSALNVPDLHSVPLQVTKETERKEQLKGRSQLWGAGHYWRVTQVLSHLSKRQISLQAYKVGFGVPGI